jgi:hypothetical protein
MMNEKIKGRWLIHGDTLKVILDSTYRERPYGHWNKENLFLVRKNKLIGVVKQFKLEGIEDKKLQKALYKQSKRYAFSKTRKMKCD